MLIQDRYISLRLRNRIRYIEVCVHLGSVYGFYVNTEEEMREVFFFFLQAGVIATLSSRITRRLLLYLLVTLHLTF